MNKINIIIFLLFFCSCVGSDTAYLPQNILEAKNQNLLINIYKPSESKVRIDKTDYLIKESFSTFKYDSKNNMSINKSYYAFILKLENVETKVKGLSLNDGINYQKFIDSHCDKCMGLDSNNIVFLYDDITKRNKIDSIKINFTDMNGNARTVLFTKE